MPSKKVFTILIICIALISSAIIYKINKDKNTPKINENSGVLLVTRENIDLNYDWKKILTDTSSSTTKWMDNTNISDENTLTDQVAKDFFAQYLLLKKNGTSVTEADALSIAQKTLSSPEFQQMRGAQYTKENLHVTATINKTTLTNYYNSIKEVAGIWESHEVGGEFKITNNALMLKDEKSIEKLDPIIADYKKIILDMISMSVPSDAVQIHLALLNNTSNVLFSIESMRASFSDPIKGLLGMDRYGLYMNNLAISISDMQKYFMLKKIPN